MNSRVPRIAQTGYRREALRPSLMISHSGSVRPS